MRKFKSDRCYEHDDGEFVLDIDAEAAIAQARRDERAKCIAELRGLEEFNNLNMDETDAVEFAAEHLAKGLE